MAQEWELKFACDRVTLTAIVQDAAVAALAQFWTEIPMETTYFDTIDRDFFTRKWTFRQRKEGARQVITLKTPTGGRARNEWEFEAESLVNAGARLLELGAPEEAERLLQKPLAPVCGAKFTRRAAMLHFADGSKAELALDEGILFRGEKTLSFWELELEAKSEGREELLKLAAYLKLKYALKEEPCSKFARAVRL